MITDEQIQDAYLQQYERGILKREVRSYEISLWTLQDEFITVLKWSDVEQKGRIENPKLVLNIDGTEKLTFSIPMYYRVNNELVENPNWYTVKDGVLIKGLRKLKVIFNKGEEYSTKNANTRSKIRSEHTFELLIINIKENHESDIPSCEVEAEGLAFQELGKIGYKLNLSLENFEEDYKKWQETGQWKNYFGTTSTSAPVATVDYWCQNACHLKPYQGVTQQLNPRQWYYSVEMRYDLVDDTTGLIHNSNKVYEDPYGTEWNASGQPTTLVNSREKARILSIENSNVYNITQEIAETFGIFCKYKYLYDDNYHIIGRLIIFYNSFIQGSSNTLSFTYPYSAKSTSRIIDSADITTKLYVLSVDNDNILEGKNTIMNSEANMSREDYILNFDYLYDTGAITRDQYVAKNEYLSKIREYNDKLLDAQQALNTYNVQITDLKAKQTIYKNSIDIDQEQELQNSALATQLDSRDGNADGYIELTGANCDYCIILTDSITNKKYVNLKTTNKGIVQSSIRIYTNLVQNTLSGEITSFEVQTDEYNNAIAIYFTTNIGNTRNVYLTYTYNPKLYYDNIVTTWKVKLAKDREAYDALTRQIGPTSATEENYSLDSYPSGTTLSDAYDMGLNKLINDTEELIEELLEQKESAMTEFEQMMGPAIREGYWQPEDYQDYGDLHNYSSKITNNDLTENTFDDAIIAWDTELFEDEDKLTYQVGIGQRVEYYPCIDLSAVFPSGIPNDLSEYSLVWKATPYTTDYGWNSLKDLTIFAVGSKALFKFIKVNSTYKPVLVITGAKTLSVSQLIRMIRDGSPRLEKYKTTVDSNGDITISHGSATSTIATNKWLCYRLFDFAPTGWSTDDWQEYSSLYTLISSEEDACMAYPRIKISSVALKTDTDNLAVKYGEKLLTAYNDYYTNIRNTYRKSAYHPEYFITIKPESIVKNTYSTSKKITVYYALSNADTAIYLDALKISKENAYPKVSYEVNVNTVNTDLIHGLYDKLAQIIMINDTELKFENVFGYISGLELNLDKPWEDTVEVKNYSNKFEDLFSTIVATSEAMRQNEGLISSLFSRGSWMNNFNKSANSINEYLDSYFKTSLTVKQRLTEIFTEAGEILSDSSNTLYKMRNLTLENADILSGFVTNVKEQLTPHVFYSTDRPLKFKVGDIWINDNIHYVATCNSDEIVGNRAVASETAGFVRTYDGSYASITGESLNIDTVAGTIDIKARNAINIESGVVDIYANQNVNITGRESVNIGGTQINIGSETINGTPYYGGINLVATAYNNVGSHVGSEILSKVLISPTEIELGSSDILMRGSNKIQMVVSRDSTASTSAIELSAEDGVWIGSGKSIRLFSGGFAYNANTNTLTKPAETGASIELNSEHLILGYANVKTNNATAIEMTDNHVIIAAGGALNNNFWEENHNYSTGNIVIYNNDYYKCISNHLSSSAWDSTKWKQLTVTGTTDGLIGARFTKDSIGFATIATDNTVNAILMDGVNGITLASGSVDVTLPTTSNNGDSLRGLNLTVTGGSYVRIAPVGIDISSMGYLYMETNNFIIDSAATSSNSMLELKYPLTTNNVVTNITGLKFSQADGLYVHGNIINDSMIFVNSGYTTSTSPSKTYSSGLYVTSASSTGIRASIVWNDTTYYAWKYNNKTYYCTVGEGETHTVTNDETVLTYNSTLVAVTPINEYLLTREMTVYDTDTNELQYTYKQQYFSINGTTVVYDGSNDPSSSWYQQLVTLGVDNTYVTKHYSSVKTLGYANVVGVTLVRPSYNVTFSVEAETGYTTINTGLIGNFYISNDGLYNGSITGSDVSSSAISGCTIEEKDSGYYPRCFYDLSIDSENGKIKFKNIKGDTVEIDIRTLAKDSTNASTCVGCDAACTTGCDTGCTSSCAAGCAASCAGGCSGGCSGGCAGCTAACQNNCDTSCSGECAYDCSAYCQQDCSEWCYNSCGSACTRGCAYRCTASCGHSAYIATNPA